MITTIVSEVWLVYFKDSLQTICDNEVSCIRFFGEWCRERGLNQGEYIKAFKFIRRDVTKLTQRKLKERKEIGKSNMDKLVKQFDENDMIKVIDKMPIKEFLEMQTWAGKMLKLLEIQNE